MKKLVYLLLGLSLTFVLNSCSSEEQNSNLDEEKIEFVLQSKSSEVTKAAYQLLTPEEKHFIWDERMDYILEHEDLTTQQRGLIIEIKANLSDEIFFDELTTEGSDFEAKFPETRFSIFEPIQGYYYFGSLINMPDSGTWTSIKAKGAGSFYASSLELIDDSKGLGCNCHKGSIFSPGCDYNCAAENKTRRGCGAFLMYACNGRITPWDLDDWD